VLLRSRRHIVQRGALRPPPSYAPMLPAYAFER